MRTLSIALERLDGEIGMLGFWVPIKKNMQKNVLKCVLEKYRKVVRDSQEPTKWPEHWSAKSKSWLRTCSKGSRALLIKP